ncbi:MAG: glycoside hydrolase family 16 protein [Rhodothermales bacterium]
MSSSFASARALALVAVLIAFGTGCDNSVDQTFPDPLETPEGWTLVWADEFDGTELDASKWEAQLGDGCPSLCGWGNNEQQRYRAENAEVSDGFLTITARQFLTERDTVIAGSDTTVVDTTYTSARLRTKGMGDWTYGRFEIRAKLPRPEQGLWPAIWMLSTEEVYGTWPKSGEIDIMEAVGREPGEIFGTLHYGDDIPNNVFTGESFEFAAGTYADDFFVFALEWEAGEIRWYINNVLYATQNEWTTAGPPVTDDPEAPETAPFPAPFDQDFHLLLNVAVGGNLPGQPDETTLLPQQMEVDYVRVYQRAE